MKNNTTSFTMLYSHDHDNDTKLVFTKTADRAEIELAFTSEDPDYGTETLVCGGNATETFMSLCESQLDELTTFLDNTCDGTLRYEMFMKDYPMFDDLNNTSLIAFEAMLQSIVCANERRKLTAGKNKSGHEFKVAPIGEIAVMVREKFVAGGTVEINISTAEYVDNADPDDAGEWYKIVKLDLPFDNMPGEIALLMGYYGGGNVTFAYKHFEDETKWFDDQITEMICNSTGESASTVVYAEFVNKKEEKPEKVRVTTSVGTLVATTYPNKYYPGIYVGLDRNGKHFGAALIEVDQDDTKSPTLKTHVYDADPNNDEPEHDMHISMEEIDTYMTETKF